MPRSKKPSYATDVLRRNGFRAPSECCLMIACVILSLAAGVVLVAAGAVVWWSWSYRGGIDVLPDFSGPAPSPSPAPKPAVRDDIDPTQFVNVHVPNTPTPDASAYHLHKNGPLFAVRNVTEYERATGTTASGVPFKDAFAIIDGLRTNQDCLAHHHVTLIKAGLSERQQALNLVSLWWSSDSSAPPKHAINLRIIGHEEGVRYRADVRSPRYDNRDRTLTYLETIYVHFVDADRLSGDGGGRRLTRLELRGPQAMCVQIVLDEMRQLDPFL